jgi:hypothetical protein
MSVYVGIDVHRKRSQVAVVTEDGQVQLNKNVVNGSEPMLRLIGDLPSGTPVACAADRARAGSLWCRQARPRFRGNALCTISQATSATRCRAAVGKRQDHQAHRRSAIRWSSDPVVGSAADAGALLAVGPALPHRTTGAPARAGWRWAGGAAAAALLPAG